MLQRWLRSGRDGTQVPPPGRSCSGSVLWGAGDQRPQIRSLLQKRTTSTLALLGPASRRLSPDVGTVRDAPGQRTRPLCFDGSGRSPSEGNRGSDVGRSRFSPGDQYRCMNRCHHRLSKRVLVIAQFAKRQVLRFPFLDENSMITKLLRQVSSIHGSIGD